MRTLALCALAMTAFVPSVSTAEELSSFSKAVAAYRDHRLEESLDLAKEAVRQEPGHVDAYVLLGQLYYLKQEMEQARESWERALKLAPSRQDVRQQLDKLGLEEPVEKNLARSDTYPFVVRFAQGQSPVDLGSLRQLLRDTYRLVGQQFDYFPDHPITVILYPESGFQQIKGVSHQVAGLYDGKIRLPLSRPSPGYPLSSSVELQRVLWHEYTHAIVCDLAKGNCPVWLNEGLATLQESRVQQLSMKEFQQSFQQGKVSGWDDLWKQGYDPSRLILLYEQSHMIARYLVKRWGWNGMVGVLKDLGRGYPVQDAFRAEYRTDPAVIEADWLNWIRRNG